jgi:hypothetical protein
VNVVLARLEFELDTNRLSVADAISNLGVKTGYTFQEFIAPTGQVLELLVTDSAKIHNAIMPFGITHVEIPEKETWYSPKLMSIRKGMDLAFRAAIARTLGPSCASAWRSY